MNMKSGIRRRLLGLLGLVAISVPFGMSALIGCGTECPGGTFTSTQCFKWPPPASADAGADAGTGNETTCPGQEEAKQVFAEQGITIGTIVGEGLFGGTQCCYSTKSSDYCEE